MRLQIKLSLIGLFIIVDLFGQWGLLISTSAKSGLIINTSVLHGYIEKFNQNDNELYTGYIANNSVEEFLSKNIPLFECPDKQIEETYYFR